MTQRVAIYARQNGTGSELDHHLCQTVENRVGSVVATYFDDNDIKGRGKNAGWARLMEDLDAVDQIILINVGDLPCGTVPALLKVLAALRDHNVGLYLSDEQIDTGSTGFAVLDIMDAFRRAKLSRAIRLGQARAVAAGKRIGRPAIPARIRDRIRLALADGGGVRPTARRFAVSPATVIAIRSLTASVGVSG